MKNVLPLLGALVLLSNSALAQQAAPADPSEQPASSPASPGAPPPSMPPEGYAPQPPAGYAAPPPNGPATPTSKRRSTGMMIAGIIMSALGAADAAAGVVEFVAADDICGAVAKGSVLSSRTTCVDTYKIVGVTGMVVGGVLVAAGLPMAIVGGSKVPAESGSLTVRVGPGSARMTFAF